MMRRWRRPCSAREPTECSGGMVGAGDHLRRDGFAGRFVVAAGRGGLVKRWQA